MSAVIDGHNDLPWAMRGLGDLAMAHHDLAIGFPDVRTDLPRLRAGGVTGQFWSVYVPSSLTGAEAVSVTLEQIDFVHRMVGLHPDELALATTAGEVEAAWADGRIASLIGMEGGHAIDSSLGVPRMMFALGVRYLTLTHNDNSAWAGSATDVPLSGGLSPFGESVVSEMNRLGMLVDLSHVSSAVMRRVLEITSAPVIFSHSAARALCAVERNVPDDRLKDLSRNGGICMVPFVPDFLTTECADWHRVGQFEGAPRPEATAHDVADHIDHVRDVAGIDHVGIGGDYDGTGWMPSGLEDVSCYPRVFDILVERGWSADDLRCLRTDNVLRVLRAAEDVAAGGEGHSRR